MNADERERAMREGIARTARNMADHAARNGSRLTTEQAQARVVRAINTTNRQQGD